MCKPASFVIVKNRGLKALWDKDVSDSHEDIIKHFGLRETNVRGEITFVRVEIVPPNENYLLPLSKWEYRLDQDNTPPWYDAEKVEKAVRAELKNWVKAKIVKPNQRVDAIKSGYMVAVYGTVASIHGGTVKYIYGGTVENIYGGTVESIHGGTVKYIYGGTVEYIYGGTVEYIHGGTVEYRICPDMSVVKGKTAVIIDRSGNVPVCYVGPQTKPAEKNK